NFVSNDRGDSCRVGCYLAATHNIPVASRALFWVASMVYHWFPEVAYSQGSTDTNACQRSSGWRRLLCCRDSFCWLARHVVFKRAHGQPGTSDGKASSQPNEDSEAATRS